MKSKIALALKIVIGVDLAILLLNFLSSRFGIEPFFPAPGKRLNNPLGALMIFLFSLGLFDEAFKNKWFEIIKNLLTKTPARLYLFSGLILTQAFLIFMHFLLIKDPKHIYWNLDVEQGYGTYFSCAQLFFVGLTTLIILNQYIPRSFNFERKQWGLISGLFFYLALDEVLGIHDAVGKLIKRTGFRLDLFDVIHQWLWLYSPVILAVIVGLIWFFIKISTGSPKIRAAFFSGLSLWILVIVCEAVSRLDMGPAVTIFMRALEEGAEMLGATLFLLGFSLYIQSREKSPGNKRAL